MPLILEIFYFLLISFVQLYRSSSIFWKEVKQALKVSFWCFSLHKTYPHMIVRICILHDCGNFYYKLSESWFLVFTVITNIIMYISKVFPVESFELLIKSPLFDMFSRGIFQFIDALLVLRTSFIDIFFWTPNIILIYIHETLRPFIKNLHSWNWLRMFFSMWVQSNFKNINRLLSIGCFIIHWLPSVLVKGVRNRSLWYLNQE